MADVPMVMSEDPHEMLGVGRRHLVVGDYSSAVTSLGKACELLALKHGQTADECGEAYFWYGKSLLGLAREESGVLGDGIPQGGEDNEEDGEDEVEADGEAVEADGEAGEEDESEEKDQKMEESNESGIESENNESGEKESPEKATPAADGPSSSSGAGPSSSSDPGPSGEQDEENEEDEENEDEVENLQLAWEVFELARDIFIKRGDSGKKELADVYLYLGEVGLESETYDKAVMDMTKSLQLFKELYSPDDRRIAETHYQIGLAHSLSNGFNEAIEHFQSASDILQTRIKNLENPASGDPAVKKHQAADPFYTVDGEIKELKELLPEIQDKIHDMHEYKAETIRSLREQLGLNQNGNGSKASAASSASAGTATVEKKASDISHLVKRKRKASEEDKTEDLTAKKPAT